jgi:hypothetical protein
LALREAGRLIFVRVHAAELFPIGIVDTHEVMVMFAAAIFAERSLASSRAFFRPTFCHVGHPNRRECAQHYLKGASAAQVPEKIVTRASLQGKRVSSGMRTGLTGAGTMFLVTFNRSRSVNSFPSRDTCRGGRSVRLSHTHLIAVPLHLKNRGYFAPRVQRASRPICLEICGVPRNIFRVSTSLPMRRR